MTTPVEISWEYQLPPVESSDWVEVTGITDGTVYVTGVYGDIAAWFTPLWKFPDLVVNYKIGGYYLLTEDGSFDIATEDAYELIGK